MANTELITYNEPATYARIALSTNALQVMLTGRAQVSVKAIGTDVLMAWGGRATADSLADGGAPGAAEYVTVTAGTSITIPLLPPLGVSASKIESIFLWVASGTPTCEVIAEGEAAV